MVKKNNNTRIANLTLGGITLGFLLSYPFHATFAGGLISSGCTAGMIGGLADWFAVTALFRRPLGIRPGKIVRTEIIPGNRERIFTALADMVQGELLSRDVLKQKLPDWDFAEILTQVFIGQELKSAVGQLIWDFSEELRRTADNYFLQADYDEFPDSTLVRSVDKSVSKSVDELVDKPESLHGTSDRPLPKSLSEALQKSLSENLQTLELVPILASVLESLAGRGRFEPVLNALGAGMKEFLDRPVAHEALENMIEAALNRYEASNPTRKIVGRFLPAPSVLADGLLERARQAADDGTVEVWLTEAVSRLLRELKTSRTLQEKITDFCARALSTGSFGKELSLSGLTEWGINKVRDHWSDYLETLEHKPALKHTLNLGIRSFLERQIDAHHEIIGRLVREGLEPITNEQLVALLEDKAGNDLQMIRINGSVVGGLAGMLIYVLGMVFR